MSPAEQRRLLSTGRKAYICVEPLLFHTAPDVASTRAKVATWCRNNLTSTVFEVAASRPFEWTQEKANLEVVCLLAEDAKKVREFFNHADDLPF